MRLVEQEYVYLCKHAVTLFSVNINAMAVEWVAILLRNPASPGSNLGPKSG
jgi:hypothetical protein